MPTKPHTIEESFERVIALSKNLRGRSFSSKEQKRLKEASHGMFNRPVIRNLRLWCASLQYINDCVSFEAAMLVAALGRTFLLVYDESKRLEFVETLKSRGSDIDVARLRTLLDEAGIQPSTEGAGTRKLSADVDTAKQPKGNASILYTRHLESFLKQNVQEYPSLYLQIDLQGKSSPYIKIPDRMVQDLIIHCRACIDKECMMLPGEEIQYT